VGLHLPVIDRVGVPEDVLLEECRMHADEGFGVKGSSHIIDISLSGFFQTREVALPQGVQEPCKLVFGVLSQERLVGGCRVALNEVSSDEPFVEEGRRERGIAVSPLDGETLLWVVNDGLLRMRRDRCGH
jgi:hypothetical protein